MASRKSADESMSETWSQSLMDQWTYSIWILAVKAGAQQKRSRKESKGSKRKVKIPTETIAAEKLKFNEENCILPKFPLEVILDGKNVTNKEVSHVYAITLLIFQTWLQLLLK